jgi:signal transduction histidine kinase
MLILTITVALDFAGYVKKHRMLQRIFANPGETYSELALANEEVIESEISGPILGKTSGEIYDEMSWGISLIENDYRRIIEKLGNICADNRNEFDVKRKETIDYYTTWVHQIKTPISVMRMSLMAKDTDKNRELLTELFRIEQYVEMALNYVRLDGESSDFVFKSTSADKIIRESIRKYAPVFIRRKTGIKYEGTDLVVVTDEKWLNFVLEQILSNAVKYTEGGRVTINADNNSISIKDTGIGISKEDLPRIFDKGFTGYNGRADKKATGLGLYLCKNICDKLGVMISAKSEVGKGTEIILYFDANFVDK